MKFYFIKKISIMPIKLYNFISNKSVKIKNYIFIYKIWKYIIEKNKKVKNKVI